MAIFEYDNGSFKREVEENLHPWARTIIDVYSDRIKHAHNSINNPMYLGEEKKEQPNPDRVRFTVLGDRVTKEFIYCANLVKGLYKYRWKNFDVPVIRGFNTVEWLDVVHDLKIRLGGIAYCVQSSAVVLMNDNIIGGQKELQQLVETKFFYYLCLDYYNEGVAEFARFTRSSNRPFAYMHVSIDDKHIGTLIYMLYADEVPYTCENFLRLCKEKRGGYGGTPVHRIVKDGWIQCGGFALKSTPLSCENFLIPFDRRGVLAMANNGRDDECSTQFFVILQPAPWMKQKYVAFGQLIEGAATLAKIESVKTWYESPTSKIVLYQCGILNMECHDITINKEVTQYVEAHTEDLNLLAELLWEHLVEKTFLEAQMRELERMRAPEGEGADASSPHGGQTKMDEKISDVNNEFDVEEIEFKEEEEDDSYMHQSLKTDSSVVKTKRPYYIPLTDVSYPGDVESDFDLKKFLKGDYCLESDLSYTKSKLAAFPSEIWKASESSTTISEQMSLGSEEQEELEQYIKANADRVSYAGEVVKNITQETKRKSEDLHGEPIFTDERLRKIKLATTEYYENKRRKAKVSLACPTRDAERATQVKRRQTGFIRPEDLAKLLHANLDDDSDDDDDDDDSSSGRATGIKFNKQNMNSVASRPPVRRRLTTYVKATHYSDDDDDDDDDDVVVEEENRSKLKGSVLDRLYDEVNDNNEIGPTLKNYIPTAEMQHKNLLELTHYTPLFEMKESRDQYKRPPVVEHNGSFENVLYLRHGLLGMSRKIVSTDYVKTIEMENNRPRSIRSVEYAKKRPTISVTDYQLANQRYQEQLKRKANLGSCYENDAIMKRSYWSAGNTATHTTSLVERDL